MKSRRRYVAAVVAGVTTVLMVLGAMVAGPASAATVTETMTDRCSSDVWVAQSYNGGPVEGQGILLIRQGNTYGYSDWMPVNGHSWIRWWCHSTTGNWADPGTWRIDGLSGELQCNNNGDCTVSSGSISISFSSRGGWTAERSRCDASSTRYIRARLGPDRLLRMQCITP